MRFLKIVFYFFLVFLIFLLSFEIFLNFTGFFYKMYRKTTFMPYRLNRDYKVIITMGDSYTYGGNVKWNENYPYKLWKKLNDDGNNVKLINASACEENSSQLLYKLKELLKQLKKVDILIVLTGSSDFWNLIDPSSSNDKSDNFFINFPNYENLQIELMNRMYNEDNFLKKFKLFKFFRILYLNIQASKIMSNIDREVNLNRDEIIEVISSDLFYKLLKKRRYKEVIDYSFKIFEKLDENSSYFSQNLSLYFAIAISYQLQSYYTAKDIYNKMLNILTQRKFLAKNEVFLKYLNYFKEKDKFEEKAATKLRNNLKELIKISKENSITLIFLTYPSQYKIANTIIRDLSSIEKIKLIDLERYFKYFEDNSKYLEEDEHLSLSGHELVSEIIFSEIKKMKLW